jgi:hypothetical protein
MPKKQVVGFALSAVAIVFLAACQAFSPGTIGVQERAGVQSASERLAEAVARTRSVDLRFVARAGADSLTGGQDTRSRAAGFGHNEGLNFITTADTLYVQGAPEVPEGVWARASTAKIAASCSFAAAGDPIYALSLVLAATSVEPVDDTNYSGRADLGKVTGSAATMKTNEFFSALAEGSTSEIPFTATTDSSGFVTSVTATFRTADGELPYSLTLSAFGTTHPVAIPTSAVEAPSYVYG